LKRQLKLLPSLFNFQGAGITKRPLYSPGKIVRWSDFYPTRSNEVLKPALLFRELSVVLINTKIILGYFLDLAAQRVAMTNLCFLDGN
jgi:hypothetical protein